MKTVLRKIGKGAACFFTVSFVLFGVATMPSLASLLFYVAALTLLPIRAWQNILTKYLPYFEKYKVLGTVALAVIALLVAPGSTDPAEPAQVDVQSAVITDSAVESFEEESEAESVTSEDIQESAEPEGSLEQVPEQETNPEMAQDVGAVSESEPILENAPVPESEPEPESESKPKPEPEPESVGTDYVGNISSKKFHYSWCSSVKKMKEGNKYYFNGNRDQMIAKGYEPCGNCHP